MCMQLGYTLNSGHGGDIVSIVISVQRIWPSSASKVEKSHTGTLVGCVGQIEGLGNKPTIPNQNVGCTQPVLRVDCITVGSTHQMHY